MKNSQDQMSEVFLNIEADLGTTGLLMLVFDMIVKSAKDYKVQDVEKFYDQLQELICMVKNTKPRIGIVIYYLSEIWDQMRKQKAKFKTMGNVVAALEEIVKEKIKETEVDANRLVEYGVDLVEDEDSILVQSHSKVVLRILEKAWQQGKKFRVVVAEQELEKTKDNIQFLYERKIPFTVVPEFMLSHIEHEINKVFLGALTLNNNYCFVTDAGTSSVVAEFHQERIPIYMFVVTKKFSLWENPITHHTYKTVQKKIEKRTKDILTYERIKFSHDRVNLDSVDWVITEKGKSIPKAVRKMYQEKFAEYQEWRKNHFCIEM